MVDSIQNDDDGFSDPPSSRGSDYFRYDEDNGWRDRDGVAPKGVKVVVKIGECAIAWVENRQVVITKPFNLDELNASIPVKDWPVNKFTGNQEPPYKLGVFVLMVDPTAGATHRFVHHTDGARIAYEDLKEATAVMRKLRDIKNLYPIVELSERPMRKRGKWGKRPHFEIVGWKTSDGDGGRALPPPATPLLPASAPAPGSTPAPEQPASATPSAPQEPRPHPTPAPATKPPSAKRPVTVSAYTKATLTGTAPMPGMTDVMPPTTEELLDDSLEDLPWDSDPKSSTK
jgi:hypothetical protein